MYTHRGDDDSEPVKFHVTVTFAEEDGRTRLTLHMVFPTAEERDRVVKDYGAVEGGKQTLAASPTICARCNAACVRCSGSEASHNRSIAFRPDT